MELKPYGGKTPMDIDPKITISDDKTLLDIEITHGFMKRSFWAASRTRETLLTSIENSVCFGAYCDGKQIAFARVVTDGCTFSYLCDVFVDESHRKKGVSKLMMTAVMKHPRIQSFRRFLLATKDAHGLYSQFGFRKTESPERFMEIKNDYV
jgi:GNAT superfamily N-acetyltransferase